MAVFNTRVWSYQPLLREHLSTRPLLQKLGVTEEFLLAWIHHESGGDFANVTTMKGKAKGDDERGFFQVMHSEAESLGWSRQRFFDTVRSPEDSMRNGLEMVEHRVRGVRALLAKAGFDRVGFRDFWYYVKLMHGLPLYVKIIARDAVDRGAPPPTFKAAIERLHELSVTKPRLFIGSKGSNWANDITKITNNSLKIGRFQYRPDDAYPPGVRRLSPDGDSNGGVYSTPPPRVDQVDAYTFDPSKPLYGPRDRETGPTQRDATDSDVDAALAILLASIGKHTPPYDRKAVHSDVEAAYRFLMEIT